MIVFKFCMLSSVLLLKTIFCSWFLSEERTSSKSFTIIARKYFEQNNLEKLFILCLLTSITLAQEEMLAKFLRVSNYFIIIAIFSILVSQEGHSFNDK